MNILLTGGTGFFGSYLLKRIIEEEHNVILLKRSSSNTWRIDHLIHKVVTYDADVIDLEIVFKENTIDRIIHAATLYGKRYEYSSDVFHTNVCFPLKLLDLSIIHKISYFYNIDTSLNESVNLYASTKKTLKNILEKQFSNRINVINCPVEYMYGPMDSYDKFIPTAIKTLLLNEPLKMTKGEQSLDFIYIEDAVNALLALLSLNYKRKRFEEFQLGTGDSHRLKQVIHMIKKLAMSKSKIEFGAIKYRSDEIMNSKANIEPLIKLGWLPKVSLKEGLRKTVNWYKENLEAADA